MKGRLNVTAPYSQEILFTLSRHGFRERKIWKQEGMWIKEESRSTESGREGGIETKHINTGIGGLTAHILGFFFPREKTTAAMNVFPMNLQLQA